MNTNTYTISQPTDLVVNIFGGIITVWEENPNMLSILTCHEILSKYLRINSQTKRKKFGAIILHVTILDVIRSFSFSSIFWHKILLFMDVVHTFKINDLRSSLNFEEIHTSKFPIFI